MNTCKFKILTKLYKYIWIYFFIVLLTFLFLSGTNGCAKRKDTLPKGSDSTLTPTQEVVVSTYSCFEGPYLVWKLRPDYTYKTIGDSGSILAVPIRLTLFDSLGDTTTTVLSDSGRTTDEYENIYIWGNVFIKNQEGLVVKSQSLWWNKATRKVGSDDFVEIRNPDGNILRGKGLDASDSFSWWTLRENVSGEFPNFEDRVDIDEDTL